MIVEFGLTTGTTSKFKNATLGVSTSCSEEVFRGPVSIV